MSKSILEKTDFFCMLVNDVKQINILFLQYIEFVFLFYAHINSALFSFGVKYPKTAIGILLDLFKYAAPCFLKSSML